MTNFQGHVEWCTAVLLHTPCIFSVLHSPRTAEAVGMCKYVCSYWLSVLSPAYLFAHSAMDSPVHVRKVREEACSLLYCWDFKLIFVYLPDWSVVSLSFATWCGAVRSASTSPVFHFGVTGQVKQPQRWGQHTGLSVTLQVQRLICYYWSVRIISSISMNWGHYHSQIREDNGKTFEKLIS